MTTTYGPTGAAVETSVQDAVDLVWWSYPEDDPIVIDELEGGRLVAVWTVPLGGAGPPMAHSVHRAPLSDRDRDLV